MPIFREEFHRCACGEVRFQEVKSGVLPLGSEKTDRGSALKVSEVSVTYLCLSCRKELPRS